MRSEEPAQTLREICVIAAVRVIDEQQLLPTVAALVEAVPTFGAGTGGFSIGLTSRETDLTYKAHLSEDEGLCFAAFVIEFCAAT